MECFAAVRMVHQTECSMLATMAFAHLSKSIPPLTARFGDTTGRPHRRYYQSSCDIPAGGPCVAHKRTPTIHYPSPNFLSSPLPLSTSPQLRISTRATSLKVNMRFINFLMAIFAAISFAIAALAPQSVNLQTMNPDSGLPVPGEKGMRQAPGCGSIYQSNGCV
jgi:hypothetical protein